MRLLSAIVFAWWVLAFFRTLLNLALLPRLRRGAMPSLRRRVSIIIPARDEERSIGRTVRAMLAQTYPDLEVIVVDDRSTDATGGIVRAIAAEDGRVVAVQGVEPPPGWLGKPWALHQGSQRATGELLLFVDADVVYAPEALAAALDCFERTGTAMVTLLPNMEMHGFWEHAAMPMLAMTAFTFLPSWAGNRTRLPFLAVGGGPGNLIARADYDVVGGHEALRDAVVDDVGLARLVRRSGRRTSAVRAEELVSIRMYHGGAEIVAGFTKNVFSVFSRSYAVAFAALFFVPILHLLPYALALLGDPYAIGTVAVIAVTRVILFGALRYRLDNALFLHPVMTIFWGWVFVRSIWYTGFRRELLWRGRTYDARQTRFGADR